MNHQTEVGAQNAEDSTIPEMRITRRQLLSLTGIAGAGIAGASFLASTPIFAVAKGVPMPGIIELSALNLALVDQEWNVAGVNRAVSGKPLSVAGRSFARGVGTHAKSRITVDLGRKTRRFRALVGVDDAAGAKASIRFSVRGDGIEIWRSEVMRRGDAARALDVDVSKVRYLSLNVDGTGDGVSDDHADWASASFEGVAKRPFILPRLPADEPYFLPGRLWIDQNGERIQAHGGGLLRHGGKWWWHGENRSNGYIATGVSAYYSSDLRHWTQSGLALPRAAYDKKHGDQTVCERPKVIYNFRTRQFVMWFHFDRSGYGDSRAGVAVSDSPQGPFRYLGEQRPIENSTFRDMNLHVASDGSAYVYYSGEENQTMHVVRLNAAWTAPQTPMIEGQTWNRVLIGKAREAPAPFEHAGKTYLITSGTSGWSPNRAELSVASTVIGPYEFLGDPCFGPDAETTFHSQSTFVLPVVGAAPGHFIYMGDRWKPESLADSRYVWLPFQMSGAPGEIARIEWNSRWKLR